MNAGTSALAVKQLAPTNVHTSCRTQVQTGAVNGWPESWEDNPDNDKPYNDKTAVSALEVKHMAPASVHSTTRVQNTFAMTNKWPESWA